MEKVGLQHIVANSAGRMIYADCIHGWQRVARERCRAGQRNPRKLIAREVCEITFEDERVAFQLIQRPADRLSIVGAGADATRQRAKV